tara:strand:- start:431 stop:799 length:369 start_codon:yes stop_codon:yes gene_type:complete
MTMDYAALKKQTLLDENTLDIIMSHVAIGKAIAWDTCHKIYILMDDEQVNTMRGYGYGDEYDPDSLITSSQMTTDQLFNTLLEWLAASCNLRFIQAVSTADYSQRFVDIVRQGYLHTSLHNV